MKKEEIFPVVDPTGKVVGKATRQDCHSGSMKLHPVVHMHIMDGDGRILLQKRSENKDIQPGRWDTAVGGHVDYGEEVKDALLRECREELGIHPQNFFHLITYEFNSEVERELVHAYCMIVDAATFNLKPDNDEIQEVRFWTPDEIEQAKGQLILTPNFESEYERVKPLMYELI